MNTVLPLTLRRVPCPSGAGFLTIRQSGATTVAQISHLAQRVFAEYSGQLNIRREKRSSLLLVAASPNSTGLIEELRAVEDSRIILVKPPTYLSAGSGATNRAL